MCVMNSALQLRANISFLLHLPTPESNNLQLLQRFTQSSDYQVLSNQRMLLSVLANQKTGCGHLCRGISHHFCCSSASFHCKEQGELDGGRNRFWHWKDTELLCMHGSRFLLPAHQTQAKTIVCCYFYWIMFSILLRLTRIQYYNLCLQPVSPSF